MRWDKDRARKQVSRDRRERMAAEAYAREISPGAGVVPSMSKAQMRAELERLGVSADKPIPKPGKVEWTPWRTVERPDGTTYQERECHHPGRKTEDLYQKDGTPW